MRKKKRNEERVGERNMEKRRGGERIKMGGREAVGRENEVSMLVS